MAATTGDQRELVQLMVENELRGLAADLAEGGSERLRAWLDHCSSFYQYSARNQFLIRRQCPHAGRVASKGAWEKQGQRVRADAKGILIWAWLPLKPRDGDAEAIADGETPSRLRDGFFKVVPVYDEGSLEAPETLPSPYAPERDPAAHAALADRMLAAMGADGLRVELAGADVLGAARGDLRAGRRVRILASMGTGERFGTMAHEWAHDALQHLTDSQTPLAEIEAQAEATAYVVCRHFGVERAHSADYLTAWRITPKALGKQLAAVQAAAKKIIGALDAPAAAAAA